jgi:CheY-like chemotaxis protein
MYIQIIDDNEAFRTILERNLTIKGHRVCWSSTGKRALEQLIIEKDIELILLDINLGEGHINGFDVIRFINDDNRLSNIPLIIISAVPVDQIQEGARQMTYTLLNKALIMSKPLHFETLDIAINNLTIRK